MEEVSWKYHKMYMATENRRRKNVLFAEYNPLLGIGSPVDRFALKLNNDTCIYLPVKMKDIPWIARFIGGSNLQKILKNHYPDDSEGETQDKMNHILYEISKERIKYDFEFWAFSCVKIQDKKTKQILPFKLNYPQRKTLKVLMDDFLSGKPIRIIILKARQWGGSTLVQLFMAWIQLFHETRWHSAIVADVENQARNIRGMYRLMADYHPKDVIDVQIKPFEGSSKNKVIKDRDCIIAIGSMQQPESLRSFDFAMCHLSEVGLWKATQGKKPEDLIQAIRSTVPAQAKTMVVLESTAKGVGNFFHTEWIAAKEGKSGYTPVFVAWWEIEMYQLPFEDEKLIGKFVRSLTSYERYLWNIGATLEGINWYRNHKKSENLDDWRMQSEYPSDDKEAFASTGSRAFAPEYVAASRIYNRKPEFVGDIQANGRSGKDAIINITFAENSKGFLSVWDFPDTTRKVKNRYVVSVDIGGRSAKADYSVIRVIDRAPLLDGGVPEAVLTWRGHLDQDLVIWKAVMIARIYGDAMLAVESNSLRKEVVGSEGDHIVTILDEIKDYYDNIYSRTDPEKVREGAPVKYGYHTNVKTKVALIDNLNKILREEGYIEPDSRVCDEYDIYEMKPDGSYGAVEGSDTHDDLVMCTAIGLKVSDEMDMPVEIDKDKQKKPKRSIASEATF